MGKGKRTKSPSQRASPNEGKNPRSKQYPTDRETIGWAFSVIDTSGPWEWPVNGAVWEDEIFPKLQNYESITWADIKQAAGGKSRGTNSKSVSVSMLSKKAQDRLEEIRQHDVDELFSLRLSGKGRVWGIRDGRILRLLWYDPHHEVYS